MQAIVTKFLPASNVRGARIKATCAAGSVTIPYDHSARAATSEAHRKAVVALVQKMGWTNDDGYPRLVGGQMANGDWAWVFANTEDEVIVWDQGA